MLILYLNILRIVMTPTNDNEINQKIGILLRREIEAKLIVKLADFMSKELGENKSRHIIREVIKGIAIDQGNELSEIKGNSLEAFIDRQEPWTRDGSLETEIIKKDTKSYHYNVTKCKYSEMYKLMGLEEIGFDLSCNRDFNLVAGFNKNIKLKRTKTLMQGDSYCDFRYDVEN